MSTTLIHKKIITKRLKRDFYHESLKKKEEKTLTLEDETPKVLWAPRWLVDMSTSQGHNVFI
jgi:hypothetical protein